MNTLSPMFIEHEIRQGLAELAAQQVVRDRAEARNFGTRAAAIHRAGRKVWTAESQCGNCEHYLYDAAEYEIDCGTPRCPNLLAKRNTPTHLIANRSPAK